MNKWHYERDGQRMGGVTVEEMGSLIAQRVVDGRTLVWAQGFKDWTALQETELAVHLTAPDTPPMLPASRISNTVVWVLAAAPVLGALLEGFVAGILSQNEYALSVAISERQYWYITLLLNIGLGILDEQRLKKAGVDTKAFGKMVFVIPVYLWKRAKALNQRPAYFWTWAGLFVLSLAAA